MLYRSWSVSYRYIARHFVDRISCQLSLAQMPLSLSCLRIVNAAAEPVCVCPLALLSPADSRRPIFCPTQILQTFLRVSTAPHGGTIFCKEVAWGRPISAFSSNMHGVSLSSLRNVVSFAILASVCCLFPLHLVLLLSCPHRSSSWTSRIPCSVFTLQKDFSKVDFIYVTGFVWLNLSTGPGIKVCRFC